MFCFDKLDFLLVDGHMLNGIFLNSRFGLDNITSPTLSDIEIFFSHSISISAQPNNVPTNSLCSKIVFFRECRPSRFGSLCGNYWSATQTLQP